MPATPKESIVGRPTACESDPSVPPPESVIPISCCKSLPIDNALSRRLSLSGVGFFWGTMKIDPAVGL